jgi:hypothetical protein
LQIKEDVCSDEENDNELRNEFIVDDCYTKINELILELESREQKGNEEFNELQKKFEIFLIKYERSLIPCNNPTEVQKFLSKIFYYNKTLSIHFNNPILVGSFGGNCVSCKNKVIDLLFTHDLTEIDMKEHSENLLKNFINALKDVGVDHSIQQLVKIDKLNYDVEIGSREKDYVYKLMLRKNCEPFYEYLGIHERSLAHAINNQVNFTSLRRLIRSWRRKFNLIFVKPECLDWIIAQNLKATLSESVNKKF